MVISTNAEKAFNKSHIMTNILSKLRREGNLLIYKTPATNITWSQVGSGT